MKDKFILHALALLACFLLIPNVYADDADGDGVVNAIDNCPHYPNGTNKGTCVKTISGVIITTGVTCTSNANCGSGETCQLEQGDYDGNGWGDVCECYADGNRDGNVTGADKALVNNEYGRDDCPLELVSGTGDTDGDGVVDEEDNCPYHFNGSALGTCVRTVGGMVASYRVGSPKHFITCTSDVNCTATGGSCDRFQGDFNKNVIGDVCECYGDCNKDGRVTGGDKALINNEYGRDDCPVCEDIDRDGYDTCNQNNFYDTDGEPADCDDSNADIYPGEIHVCDTKDNNWKDTSGNHNIPLPCGESVQLSICFSCLENSCAEWSLEYPSTIGSTIDPVMGIYTAGTSCSYLNCPVQETIVVTDPCNENISESVTVTVGQVVLELPHVNIPPDDEVVLVIVNMSNPHHEVKGIQADIVDEGNHLTCTGCTPDPDRALQFTCSASEFDNGKCRVLLATNDPTVLISEAEGSIFSIDYMIGESAPVGECIDLTAEDGKVADKFGNPLCTYADDGQICSVACGDVYPPESPPDRPNCGDGVVNVFDKQEVMDFALGLAEPSACQRIRADVPTGELPYCDPPDGVINDLDVLVISDMAIGKGNCCDYYYFGKIY
jgi:hypothetical protein